MKKNNTLWGLGNSTFCIHSLPGFTSQKSKKVVVQNVCEIWRVHFIFVSVLSFSLNRVSPLEFLASIFNQVVPSKQRVCFIFEGPKLGRHCKAKTSKTRFYNLPVARDTSFKNEKKNQKMLKLLKLGTYLTVIAQSANG